MRLSQLKRGVALGCLSLFLAAQTHALTVAEHQAAIIASSGSNQALSAAILEFPALTSDFIALAQANGSLIALDAASLAALETAGSQQAILGILSGSAAGSSSTLFLAALAAGAVYVATDDDEPTSSGGTTDGGSTDGGNNDGSNTDGGGDDTTTLPLCSEATDPSKLTVDTDCRMGNAVGTFTADAEYNNVNLGQTVDNMDFNVASGQARPLPNSPDLVHPYTRIGVPEAYKRGLTGKGMKIAVLDGGFLSGLSTTKFQTGPAHQELAGKVDSVELESAKNTNSTIQQQLAETSRNTEVESAHGSISHGTHVAALAAGNKDGKGMHGVAYEANLLLAEFSRLSAPDYDALADEFTAKKVDVWNNSWGYSNRTQKPPVDIQTNGQVEVGKLKTYIDNNSKVSFGDAMAATFGSDASDWDNFVNSIKNYQTKGGTNGKGGVVVWSNSNDGQGDIDLGDSTTNLKDADVSSALPVLNDTIKGAWITVVNATDSETAKLVFGNRDLSPVTSVSDDKKTMVVSAICGSAAEFCLTADGVQVSSATISNNTVENAQQDSAQQDQVESRSGYDTSTSTNSATNLYANETGTSQAGPIVAGAVALLRQAFPNMSAKDITTRLFVTADHSKLGKTTGTANFTTDSGATLSHGYSTIFGHGWVNLGAALEPVGSLTVATTGSARNVSLSQLGNIAVGKAMSSGVRVSLADAAFLTQDVMGAGFQATLEGRASFDSSNYIDDQITAFEQNIHHKDVSLGDSVSLSFASSTEASLDSDMLLAEGVRLNFSHGNGSSSTVGFGGDLNDAMDAGLSLSAQDVVVSSTQNDAFDIGYLSLTDDDKIWSSHKLSTQDLVVGNFATVDDAYESVGVIASQSFRPSAKSNIRLSVGSMTEQGGILGTKIDGFLGAGKASTSFVQLKGQQSLGAKTALTLSYSTALSKIDTQAGSFFTGFDDMRSESMAIGVNHNHILTQNDSLNLSLSSPLRTTAGSADLTMATSLSADNRIGFETRKLSFVPTGREVRLGLGYGASLAPGNKFELGAMAISQPGHDAAADDEFGGFFKLKQAF